MKKELKGAIIVALFLTGCQAMPYKPYARKVKIQPREGGVVALKLQHNDEDRAHAEKIMTNTCSGAAFNVLEEGEVVIGTQTVATETRQAGQSGKKVGSLWGLPISTSGTDPSKNTSSSTTQKKEWQIKYKCTNIAKARRSGKTIR